MMPQLDIDNWEHECVKVLEMGGQKIFPIYGPHATPLTLMCCVLYIPGIRNPVRLNGGEFPEGNKPIRDPDGWTYCLLKFNPMNGGKMIFSLMDATAGWMMELHQQHPSRIKATAFRIANKVRRMIAA